MYVKTKPSISSRKYANVPKEFPGWGGEKADYSSVPAQPKLAFFSRSIGSLNSVSPSFKRYNSFLVLETFGGKLASETSSSWLPSPSSASWPPLCLWHPGSFCRACSSYLLVSMRAGTLPWVPFPSLLLQMLGLHGCQPLWDPSLIPYRGEVILTCAPWCRVLPFSHLVLVCSGYHKNIPHTGA